MLLKYAVVIFIIFAKAYAMEIDISSRYLDYDINITSGGNLSLIGSGINLSMIKNKCNAHIITRFKNDLEQFIRSKALNRTSDKNTFRVKIDKHIYYEYYDSQQGIRYLGLPQEMQRMKLEEKILCVKKNRR